MDKKKYYQFIKSKNWDEVFLMLEEYPDALLQPIIGKTVLNFAVIGENENVIDKILALGYPIDFCEGCPTALSTALDTESVKIVDLLLRSGSDVNLPLKKHYIFNAIQSDSINLVKLLIESGANLKCSWERWDSPLEHAICIGRKDIAAYIAAVTNISKSEYEIIESKYLINNNESYPLKLDEESLKEVESVLGLKIPPLYREFLSKFPSDLVTGGDEGIFHSSDWIIRSTQGARNYKEEDWAQPFPSDLIGIAWNGGGSVYCIREGERGNFVYLFSHEMGEIDPEETLSLTKLIEIFTPKNE